MIETIISFILHIDQHLQALSVEYGVWIYGILFLIIFCETGLVITPFLPGDSLLFAAGSLAAVSDLNIHYMIVLLLIAAILGDAVNFSIGKYFGETLFKNPDSKIFRQKYLFITQDFYQKHGGKTIIIARFIPIIRTFVPFVAGMGKMHYPRFFIFNIIGALLWVILFSYIGYFFGNIPIIKNNLALVLVGIIIVSVLPILIKFIYHYYLIKKQNIND